MKRFLIIAKFLGGLYSSLIALIAIGILFTVAFITGNLPVYTPESAVAYSWHISGSDFGVLLQLFIIIPFAGIIENVVIITLRLFAYMTRFNNRKKAIAFIALNTLKNLLFIFVNIGIGLGLIASLFKYCD
ncbi:MAG TPA: hypothetical protein PKH33_09250 [bacterium]|nr:hypothetical protein [bacterium]